MGCRKTQFLQYISAVIQDYYFFIHFTMHSQPCFLPFSPEIVSSHYCFCVFLILLIFFFEKISIAIIAHRTFLFHYGIFQNGFYFHKILNYRMTRMSQ